MNIRVAQFCCFSQKLGTVYRGPYTTTSCPWDNSISVSKPNFSIVHTRLDHSASMIAQMYVRSGQKFLHYITLHFIALHYITFHQIISHHITLNYCALHYISSHHITSNNITSHHITLPHIILYSLIMQSPCGYGNVMVQYRSVVGTPNCCYRCCIDQQKQPCSSAWYDRPQ